MFPHVVTVFNSYEDDDLKMHNSITILRGVLLDVSKGTNVAKTGLADADAATLYIPFSVDAVSTTGDKKAYAEPKVFYAANNPQGLWTLDSGGQSNSTSTYFVKGEVTEMMSLAELHEKYDFVFDVTTVDVRDFGGDMMHWQVGGK
nr:MAG TPA_asm: hypothetical protein [Caudoviricetes sp.]